LKSPVLEKEKELNNNQIDFLYFIASKMNKHDFNKNNINGF